MKEDYRAGQTDKVSKSTSYLEGLIGRINLEANKAENMAQRLEAITTNLFGSYPEAVGEGDPQKRVEPNGHLQSLNITTDRLSNALSALSNQLAKLENLA